MNEILNQIEMLIAKYDSYECEAEAETKNIYVGNSELIRELQVLHSLVEEKVKQIEGKEEEDTVAIKFPYHSHIVWRKLGYKSEADLELVLGIVGKLDVDYIRGHIRDPRRGLYFNEVGLYKLRQVSKLRQLDLQSHKILKADYTCLEKEVNILRRENESFKRLIKEEGLLNKLLATV